MPFLQSRYGAHFQDSVHSKGTKSPQSRVEFLNNCSPKGTLTSNGIYAGSCMPPGARVSLTSREHAPGLAAQEPKYTEKTAETHEGSWMRYCYVTLSLGPLPNSCTPCRALLRGPDKSTDKQFKIILQLKGSKEGSTHSGSQAPTLRRATPEQSGHFQFTTGGAAPCSASDTARMAVCVANKGLRSFRKALLEQKHKHKTSCKCPCRSPCWKPEFTNKQPLPQRVLSPRKCSLPKVEYNAWSGPSDHGSARA